ncbi:MAG: PAS domain-containing protein [Oscillochloris sp.]|nr:PAS domain-containing protein [Oscillochloris sp.]
MHTLFNAALDIDQVIIAAPLTAEPHESLGDVIKRMGQESHTSAERGSCVLVIADNCLCGIVTEALVMRLLAEGYDPATTTAGAICVPALTYSRSQISAVQQALQLLRDHRVRHLVVLDDHKRVLGILMAANLLDHMNYAQLVRQNQDLTQQLTEQVTNLQIQTERLRRSEAHLQAAQRIAAMGSWEFDPKIGAITWSDEVYRIFGRDQALGPPTFDELQTMYLPDDREKHAQTVERALTYAESYNIELRLLHPNGEVRYIQARGEPLIDLSGRLNRLVGTTLDITERKEVEIRLWEAGTQLAAANQELEAFAYSVSHDLRAPLRAIDGFSQALVEDYEEQLAPEARDYLTRIRTGVRRMSDLIDDLLRLSRVSRTEMEYTWVNISQEAERIITFFEIEAPERVVEVQIEPNLRIWADRNLIRVALENLLSNAWKFSSKRNPARITLAAQPSDHGLVYRISDNGIGFNPKYSHKLFGVFQRLHDTNEFPGTGIGLATVQRVIHRHGGQIWAESALDHGASFFFTFPAGKEL